MMDNVWTFLPPGLPTKETWVARTENGRVKILLAGGDVVFLGENSSVRVSDNPNTNVSGIEILAGAVVAVTGEVGPSVVCEERVHLSDAGVFRFNVHRVVDQTSANSRSTKELRERKCQVLFGYCRAGG